MGEVVGSVVGGLFQKDAADKAADAQMEAARMAAEAARPYSVFSPFGNLNVNEDTRTISTALSGQAQGLLDLYAGEAGQGLGEATQERLGILDQLAARGEEEARRYTREGLFAAGNLGTHYGTRQVGEVERAIADARLSRMLSSRDMAFNERQGAFGNTLAMFQLPNTLSGLSRATPNPAVGQGFLNAASMQGAGQVGLAQGITSALGNVNWGSVGSSISNIFGGGGGSAFSSPTTADWNSFSF